MKPLIPLLAAALLILSAGCVGQFPPIFGSDVIKPILEMEQPSPNDIVVLENTRTLPDAQALQEQNVRFFTNIVSKESDPSREVNDVYVDIFDATQFRTKDGANLCNKDPSTLETCQPNQCSKNSRCILRAGETKTLHVDLTAPKEADVANVKTPARLNYKLVYSHESRTNFEILVVSEDEILRLQQEGKELSLPVRHASNAGPIQIMLETRQTTFGIEGQKMFVTLKAVNNGEGAPVRDRIKGGTLRIEFPAVLGRIEGSKEEFDTGSHTGEKIIFTSSADPKPGVQNELKGDIMLIKDESIPYQFTINLDRNVLGGAPHKTYTITAYADYKYEMRGQSTVEILPTKR